MTAVGGGADRNWSPGVRLLLTLNGHRTTTDLLNSYAGIQKKALKPKSDISVDRVSAKLALVQTAKIAPDRQVPVSRQGDINPCGGAQVPFPGGQRSGIDKS